MIRTIPLPTRVAVCAALVFAAGARVAPQAPDPQPAPPRAPAAMLAGIPAITPHQMAALSRMTAALAPLIRAATDAREAMVAATLVIPRDDPAIRNRIADLRRAEHAVAEARAGAFASLQQSADRLAPNQIVALEALGGSLLRPGPRGGNPPVTDLQRAALVAMAAAIAAPTKSVDAARAGLVAASLAMPRDDAAIALRLEALVVAEQALGDARVEAFARLQRSGAALAPSQVSALVAEGGEFRTAGLPFTEPEPIDFADHEGYVPLFDGISLNGWDGNPKFWRVEDGAIVGESTVENPSGNSYLAYRELEARDFTLKLEIKIDGNGGSGIQYRSRTGVPWLSNIPAYVGPVNLAWMMTGPQADFWPASPVYTGQFYSENTPMRILAWRGQVVEGVGAGRKRLMGTIGDRQALGDVVKMNDWNQYTIIARGGTFVHIINGQLMTVMIDDDPASSNNRTGLIGIEIEAVTKVSVRNIWLKKLN